LTTWAREQHLTNADLTVLTIAPPPRESHPRRQSRSSLVQTSGFVFSTIHLRDQGTMPAPRSRLSRSFPHSSRSICGGRTRCLDTGRARPPWR
jgi:hypothetical protein